MPPSKEARVGYAIPIIPARWGWQGPVANYLHQNGGEDTDDDPCGIPGSGAMGASARSKKQRRLVPLVGVPLFRRAAPDT